MRREGGKGINEINAQITTLMRLQAILSRPLPLLLGYPDL